jgi:hypothetical protein
MSIGIKRIGHRYERNTDADEMSTVENTGAPGSFTTAPQFTWHAEVESPRLSRKTIRDLLDCCDGICPILQTDIVLFDSC